MNFVTDQCAEGFVDQLVAGKRTFAVKLGRDHQGAEMRIVVTLNFDGGIVESGFDQPADFCWVHNVSFAHQSRYPSRGAQCNRKAHSFPLASHVCVL